MQQCLIFHNGKRARGRKQRAKKVLSDSPGLVDFAIGLVNSVSNLPNGQVMTCFMRNLNNRRTKSFWG